MSDFTEVSDELSDYVDALLQFGGQMSLIISHMASQEVPRDADPFDEVLHRQIAGVLAHPVGDPPELDLPAATVSLKETIRTIANELILLEPGELEEMLAKEDRRRRRKLPMRPRRPR